MQIVIDIPDDHKRVIDNLVIDGKGDLLSNEVKDTLAKAVKAGTPLPKGCDIQRIFPRRVDVQKWIYTECPNPNCDYELSTHHGDGYYSIEHKQDFCPNCGQALLWESEE